MYYAKRQSFTHNCNIKLSTTKKKIFGTIIFFVSLFIFSSASYAKDFSFAWTANADLVDGYKLYYVTAAGNDGTGALEGNSPVATGNVTSFTLHGLSNTEDYLFSLTAIRETAESDHSYLVPSVPLIISIQMQ